MPVGWFTWFVDDAPPAAPPHTGHPDRGKRKNVKAARKASRAHRR